MKKNILIVCSFVFFFGILSAQIPGSVKYIKQNITEKKFGFKGGINFSYYHGDVQHSRMIFGFSGGFFYDYKIGKKLFVQPEVLFNMKGSYFDGTDWGDEQDWEYWVRLYYIEIPILAKFNMFIADMLSSHVYFGPCFGFNIGSKYKFEWDDETTAETGTLEGIKVFEFSIIPGIIFEFSDNFSIDLRYSIGLSNIDDWGNAKNSVLLCMLGFKIF